MIMEPHAWPTPWPEVNRVVQGLGDALGDALGEELAGLYLCGSLALGGFDPPSSDIDVNAVPSGSRSTCDRCSRSSPASSVDAECA